MLLGQLASEPAAPVLLAVPAGSAAEQPLQDAPVDLPVEESSQPPAACGASHRDLSACSDFLSGPPGRRLWRQEPSMDQSADTGSCAVLFPVGRSAGRRWPRRKPGRRRRWFCDRKLDIVSFLYHHTLSLSR